MRKGEKDIEKGNYGKEGNKKIKGKERGRKMLEVRSRIRGMRKWGGSREKSNKEEKEI